ncbi:hypothetical protein [Streptomyces sp. ALB3]
MKLINTLRPGGLCAGNAPPPEIDHRPAGALLTPRFVNTLRIVMAGERP